MMKLPQHRTPSRPERRATAPYNFVPLPEAIFFPEGQPFQEHDRLHLDRRHGSIDLEITTETSTYTRCATPADPGSEDPASAADFYHHGDPARPVLPGSSLRGMIRSLVEIMSSARLTRRPPAGEVRIRDEQLMHRAVADQKTSVGKAYNARFLNHRGNMAIDYPSQAIHAGYLERNGSDFQIRPAKAHQETQFIRVPKQLLRGAGLLDKPNEITSVFVRPGPVQGYTTKTRSVELRYARTEEISKKPATGLVPAKLVMSGDIPTRHMHTAVYEPDMAAKPIPIPPSMWERFQADRDMHRGLPCRRVVPGEPCFYLMENGKLSFLGPTLFFRIPYEHRTSDYIPDPLTGDGALDLAELIFGTAGERAVRGRVAFEDAVLDHAPPRGPFFEDNGGRRTPAVLSTPKPTSYQNYLVQTSPQGERDKLHAYASPLGETALRGFKRYWHRGEPPEPDLRKQPPEAGDTQRTVIRPVRSGVVFKSRVRFENLTPLELGALLAAIELRSGARHAVGLGKPLGLGTVRLSVSSVRLLCPLKHYSALSASGALSEREREAQLQEAREAFRREMIVHHNRNVRAPELPETAEIWSIPRLEALAHLLRWDGRPAREATRPLDDLAGYRDRRVLPTPAAVIGKPDPEVDAELPASGLSSAQAPPRDGAPKPIAPHPAAVTRGGEIVRFSQGGVLVRVDGEPRPKKVAVHTDIFPLDRWCKLDGHQIRPGRRVEIELHGEQIVRVVPADGGGR